MSEDSDITRCEECDEELIGDDEADHCTSVCPALLEKDGERLKSLERDLHFAAKAYKVACAKIRELEKLVLSQRTVLQEIAWRDDLRGLGDHYAPAILKHCAAEAREALKKSVP